jgi:cytoskeletal protein CcmA (bactofilin family)
MEGSEQVKTHVADDVEIVGSVKCTSNIHIEGKLNGDLNCEGNAIIGNSANVKGNITANSTSVLGQINGNITVKDRIELKSTARLTGDIRAKRLTVEDGVTFVGKSEVNPAGHGAGKAAASEPPSTDAAKSRGGETDKGEKADRGDKEKSGGVFGRK